MENTVQDDPNELLLLDETNDELGTGRMVRVCAVLVAAPWILLLWILVTTTTTSTVNPVRASDSIDSTRLQYVPPIGPVREFTLVVTPSISGTDCSELHGKGYVSHCTLPSECMKNSEDVFDCEESLGLIGETTGDDDQSVDSARIASRTLELEQDRRCRFSDFTTRSFGTHYSTGNDDKRVLLGDLEASTDPFQAAAAKIAMIWIESQAENIFKAMGNFRYMSDQLDFEYNLDLVKFSRVGRALNQIHFIFQETSPGIVTEEFLDFLEREFRGGCAAWDDFGDVTQSCASDHGFQEEWNQVMGLPGVALEGRELNVNVRVSFLDPKARVLGLVPRSCPSQHREALYPDNRFHLSGLFR
ncbi:hypothetical protein MHU86_22163 [Fragilaria crotonensis]|nr:hypothetical protein MHU86_22163 [Fragilaria crotonensis]